MNNYCNGNKTCDWNSISVLGYMHPGFPGFAAAAYGRAGFPPLTPGFITYPTGMELLHLTSWYPEAHLGFWIIFSAGHLLQTGNDNIASSGDKAHQSHYNMRAVSLDKKKKKNTITSAEFCGRLKDWSLGN